MPAFFIAVHRANACVFELPSGDVQLPFSLLPGPALRSGMEAPVTFEPPSQNCMLYSPSVIRTANFLTSPARSAGGQLSQFAQPVGRSGYAAGRPPGCTSEGMLDHQVGESIYQAHAVPRLPPVKPSALKP